MDLICIYMKAPRSIHDFLYESQNWPCRELSWNEEKLHVRPHNYARGLTSRSLPSLRAPNLHASASPNPYPTSYTPLTFSLLHTFLPDLIHLSRLSAKIYKLPSCGKFAHTSVLTIILQLHSLLIFGLHDLPVHSHFIALAKPFPFLYMYTSALIIARTSTFDDFEFWSVCLQLPWRKAISAWVFFWFFWNIAGQISFYHFHFHLVAKRPFSLESFSLITCQTIHSLPKRRDRWGKLDIERA